MNIRPIRTQEDYTRALELADSLWNTQEGSREYELFEILAELIESYERKTRPVDFPDPIEALEFYRSHEDVSLEDLDQALGEKGLAEKLLTKKTPITVPILYALSKELRWPPQAFLKPYCLQENVLKESP